MYSRSLKSFEELELETTGPEPSKSLFVAEFACRVEFEFSYICLYRGIYKYSG